MVFYWTDDGGVISGAEYADMIRENIAYLQPDVPAYAEQLEMLDDVLKDMNE